MEWLFSLVVVLNGGKFCIEKMLAFRGDTVHFLKKSMFFFCHNLVITHPN